MVDCKEIKLSIQLASVENGGLQGNQVEHPIKSSIFFFFGLRLVHFFKFICFK